MSHSKFGWSLPPGCTTLPGENEPDGPPLYRCTHCGAFLPQKADRTEQWEAAEECDGGAICPEIGLLLSMCGSSTPHAPHRFVMDCGTLLVWDCRKCKKETKSAI